MFKSVRYVGAIKEVMARDHQCLIIAHEDETLTLLQSKNAQNCMVSILPLSGARVTLKTPDSSTMIYDGACDKDEVHVAGQNIVTLYCDGDKWFLVGAAKAERTKTRRQPPVQEVA